MADILVVKCPNCGDTWEDKDCPQQLCECFSCGREYVKCFNTKVMDDFIFFVFKKCKFNS